MNVSRKSTAFLPACLALGGFIASAVLFGVLNITPSGARETGGTTPAQETLALADEPVQSGFKMPPARSFIEIVSRPIFSPNRRPAPEEELTIETVASELEARLIGVIVASGVPIAIIEPRGGKNFARVTVGDRFQGWTVAQIEPERVTFRRDQAVERLELSFDLPPKKRPRPNTKKKQPQKVEKNAPETQNE